jgi:hypothetical protein
MELTGGVSAADLNEANEHAQALEDAIEWCDLNEAYVSFTRRAGVFIKVKRSNRMILHGAPTFLECVEQIAAGEYITP